MALFFSSAEMIPRPFARTKAPISYVAKGGLIVYNLNSSKFNKEPPKINSKRPLGGTHGQSQYRLIHEGKL